MNKQEFLTELKSRLSGLPEDDAAERIAFYAEIIDDRMEEGVSEEDAVAGIGSVDDVVSQTVSEIPIAKLMKEKLAPKQKRSAWKTVLILVGSPLWFPLLVAFAVVLLALYIVLWALIICLWAIDLCLWACALVGIAGTVLYLLHNSPIGAVMLLGAGLVSTGLALFAFYGCVAASKGVVKLTQKAALGLKSKLIGKERIQ